MNFVIDYVRFIQRSTLCQAGQDFPGGSSGHLSGGSSGHLSDGWGKAGNKANLSQLELELD